MLITPYTNAALRMLVGTGVIRLLDHGDHVTTVQDAPRPHTPEPQLLHWLGSSLYTGGYFCVPGERRCYPASEYEQDGTLRRNLLPAILKSLWTLAPLQSVGAELTRLCRNGTSTVLVTGNVTLHAPSLHVTVTRLWNLESQYPNGAALPVHLVRQDGLVSVAPAVPSPGVDPFRLNNLLTRLGYAATWLPSSSQPDAVSVDGDTPVRLSDCSRPGSLASRYLGYLVVQGSADPDPFSALLPVSTAPDAGLQHQVTALLSP